MAYHYATPPDEWEFKGVARLPWAAGSGIRRKQTQIKNLWPPSLTELFETSSPAGSSTIRRGCADVCGSEHKADDDSEGDAVGPPLGAEVAKSWGRHDTKEFTGKRRGEVEVRSTKERC